MHDLEEIVRFVAKIHGDGLETASMTEIALGCGYKNATSTPFYRRMVSGRLFGLLAKSGAELTVRARDYFKPESLGDDRKALSDAILGIPAYADLVTKFNGKKMNVELVSNGFSRSLNLSDACGLTCARAFEASLKFAGLLGSDLTVSSQGAAPEKPISKVEEPPNPRKAKEEKAPEDTETQSHVLYLDKTKQRKFEVTAPIDITAAELSRAKGFLDFALLLDQEIPKKEESGTI